MSGTDGNLEDDIRRLAEARAAGVDDVPRRDRLGARRRPWGQVVAAAAAILVLVVGVVVALTGDDDPADTEVADGGTTVPSITAVVTTTAAITSTTAEATTTTAPAGTCAAEPPEGGLDAATHLDFSRTPLDLDLDGTLDELFTYEDDSADAWVIARTAEGWTTPAFIGPVLPRLVFAPDGFPAGADLDGDGGLEFFVGGFGNTARSVAMISSVDCDLVRVRYDEDVDDLESTGLILVGVGGGSCAPIGCSPRVSCPATGELVVELTEPDGSEVVWSSSTYGLTGRELVLVDRTETRFPADVRPPDAPDADDSDVVDCTPPGVLGDD